MCREKQKQKTKKSHWTDVNVILYIISESEMNIQDQ